MRSRMILGAVGVAGLAAIVAACSGSTEGVNIQPGGSVNDAGSTGFDGATTDPIDGAVDPPRDGGTIDADKPPPVLGTHFDASETKWTVPSTGGFATGGYSQASATRWATLDIDGDGKPDLVSSADLVNNESRVWTDANGPHWKVYKNTGSAFATTAAAWPVPSTGGFASGGYAQVSATRWTTLDIDGDGKPDLVSSAELVNNEGHVWSEATNPHWKVYKNSGSGFVTTAATWKVPATGGFASGGYAQTAATRWVTMDIDGDGKPDLVSTGDYVNNEPHVWGEGTSPYWKVYKNTGSGFAATATTWPVPGTGGFANGGYSQASAARWATIDIDGDGKIDLVSSGESLNNENHVWSEATNPHWKVYKNTGSGFATTATTWSVPSTGGFASGGYSQVAATRWTTIDIDGDGKVDLVSSGESVNNENRVWGEGKGPHWKVYKNTGSGFATTAATWSVPAAGGFASGGYSQVSATRWTTIDIDGDRRVDLVSTGESVNNDARVWGFGAAPFWKVYRNVP